MSDPVLRLPSLAFVAALWAAMPAWAQPARIAEPADPVPAATARDGVEVGRKSRALSMASASEVEKAAIAQYAQLKQQAAAQKALVPADNPEVIRLRGIAARLVPHVGRFNERATGWPWEVNLFASSQVNAFCMPGGKIAFFAGILQKLQLTDDEVAIVMGHEMAHALREHGRERVGKERLSQLGTAAAAIGGALLGYGDLGGQLAAGASRLVLLRYGRQDESEADVVGLDLAARAGFDPRAGLVVWQKMAAASKGSAPEWLSSHPSNQSRLREIADHLDETMPLFARAIGKPLDAIGPYRSNAGQPIGWPLAQR